MKIKFCSSCGKVFGEKDIVYMNARLQTALCERCWTKEVEADRKDRTAKKEVRRGR